VVFALRTGAPILPMFIVREQGDRHRIIIEPPLELEKFEDDQQTLRVNITKITDLIEKYVRRYPHEWGWMHRRWKSRPNHERE
jgi:KDO2-lipid IV(A) lauroyltransferase